MWVIIYKSYGQWRCTSSVWKTKKEAERHAELYILDNGKEYNTELDYVYLTQMEDKD